MLLEKLRQDVLDAARSLKILELAWMEGGAVSARDPETGYIIVTPSGMDYEKISAKDLIIVDLDMNIIEGKYRPSVATNLWNEIFRVRQDVHALVHSHSPYATAFSVINQPIPIITETQADWFGKPITVAPYAHIEDAHFLTAPVEYLGDGFGVLLGQHGPITVGKTIHEAVERAVTLEEASKTFYIAKVIGEPQIFSEHQAFRSFEYYQNRYGQKIK
ncbi:MAG: class II aldolase/adducin family protein [Anaerolineaceae bacterium]|nr:class II aldolase/adducin family protein [Anaerolineaceae bacterium]